MINKTRTTLVVFTLLTVAALAATLAAQAPGGRGRGQMGPGFGGGPMQMLPRLDLTDAQKEQVKALTAERATQGAGRTLAGLERDLNAAVMADSPDTAKIEQLKTAILEAQTAALNDRVDLELRIAQILTPEQRQKAREISAEPRARGQRF